MAGATNGIDHTGDSLKTFKQCDQAGIKLLNTKTADHKNGAVKSTHTNGKTHKSPAEGGLPEIDWSQYDTFPGSFEKCSLLTAVLTHIGLYILMFLGFVNQLVFVPKGATERNREGYAPLYDPFEQFFSRYVYRRVRHCFTNPICSAPGAEIIIKEKKSRLQRCINLGSYNYLGFAEGAGSCTFSDVSDAVRRYGVGMCSSRAELGTTPLHLELEKVTAEFFGVEDALVFGQGFATNSLNIPGLIGEDTLVLSDEHSHISLMLGLQLSRATVCVFRHNDVRHAETLARAAIAEGKWRNILIVGEGVYAKEGSVAVLEGLVALKQALGLQLYIDEAHSVGALGGTGRGALQRCRVLGRHVDVLMGAFTKGFSAGGGYIAGSARVVRRVRRLGHASGYAHAMSPAIAAQALATLRLMDTPLGAARAAALADNTTYFRRRLREMGVVTFGHDDTPLVPMLVFSKMQATVERLLKAGVATDGMMFPTTPINKARIRFCISASHSREQLDKCLAAIERVVDELGLRYSRRPLPLSHTHG